MRVQALATAEREVTAELVAHLAALELRPSLYLTAENHEAVLGRASNRRREEIDALIAELAPQPDVVASVRMLPGPRRATPDPSALALPLTGVTDAGGLARHRPW